MAFRVLTQVASRLQKRFEEFTTIVRPQIRVAVEETDRGVHVFSRVDHSGPQILNYGDNGRMVVQQLLVIHGRTQRRHMASNARDACQQTVELFHDSGAPLVVAFQQRIEMDARLRHRYLQVVEPRLVGAALQLLQRRDNGLGQAVNDDAVDRFQVIDPLVDIGRLRRVDEFLRVANHRRHPLGSRREVEVPFGEHFGQLRSN